MLQSRGWLKIGTLVFFSSAALCCAALAINLLVQNKTAKAGIATLTFSFDLAGTQLPKPLIQPRAIPGIDLIQPLQIEAQVAASVLATATAAADSKLQVAAGVAKTTASRINAIEALIPRNCSLGTKQFCVGFSNHTTCHELPLNASDIFPEAVAGIIGDKFQTLQGLETIMAQFAPVVIRGSVIFGLCFVAILTTIFLSLIFNIFSTATFLLRLGIFLLATLCLVSFFIPTVILYRLQSEIHGLGSNVGIEKGDVTSHSMAALACATLMVLLTIMSVFV